MEKEQIDVIKSSERALLGSILVMPETIEEVKQLVKKEHFIDCRFYDNLHTRIYDAMLSCPHPDEVTVAQEMNRKGTLRPNDCAYIVGLIADVPDPLNYLEYAKALVEAFEAEMGPPSDQEIAPSEIQILEFPATAWQGLFKEYRDLVAGTTEAADAFHYATFCQVLGCTLGRRLYIYHATKLYPNFYMCLVGRSGLTRKDTCWLRANDLLYRLHADPEGDESPPFRVVKGIRSYEGLLDELSGKRKVRLIQLGELLSLLAKARQDSLGNIVPQLTELYDCPDRVNPPVHQKITDCQEPFVSIMAGTTQAWLQKALTERDIYGGFANRWLYFFGLPKEPKPNPPKVNPKSRNGVIEAINTIRLWAEDIPNGEVTISDEANELFTNYYQEYYQRCQLEGLIPTLIVRIQDFIWKLALLYAAIDLSEVIRVDHLESAIAVGNYLELSVAEVFASFGTSTGKAQEIKLLDFLKSEGGPVSEREVYRKFNMSAKELESVVTPLLKIGLVKNSYQQTNRGRQIRRYEVV